MYIEIDITNLYKEDRMTTFTNLPKVLTRIINCFAYDRDSLKQVFDDIKSIQKTIDDETEQAEMYLGLHSLTLAQQIDMIYPTVSRMVKSINNRDTRWCYECASYVSITDGCCECYFTQYD